MWRDGYEDDPVMAERGFGKWDYKSDIGTAWISSDDSRHVVHWLRGRGIVRGEDRELKPGKKTIHGTLAKAKEYAERMVQQERSRQEIYNAGFQ